MFRKSATRKVTVRWASGLHARPSLAVVQTVRRFQSQVQVRRGQRVVDAREILEVLTLAAPCGEELVLSAHGADAEAVLQALDALFADDSVPTGGSAD